jgi:DNA-binding CsgD family transcriptional regulator
MAVEIVGREAEVASLDAFLGEAQADGGSAALVLEGEPGIGKSTLWLWGVDHARAGGVRVLSSRPAEAERGLAFAGLGDLLDEVLDDVLPALAPPRRRALEVALLLEERAEDAVDPRALGLATRNALEVLAADRDVLVAIDDLQWLDASSAAALAFAVRRLATNLLLLLARRPGDMEGRSELEQALEPKSVRRLAVGPLSVGALHRVLRDRLGRPFARQTLLRIHERSGGNPFFALELARILDEDADPLEPLPLSETLEELVRARLSGLPPATREALALASALGTPSGSLLERAGVPADALEPALAADVIRRENGTIRFTHPLLSSVLYQELGEERPGVHERIAAILDEPLLRARHLALSRESPDANVAAVLDDAATLAADRGAGAVAAEIAEHALRLTPAHASDDRRRRALTAAHAHHAAGEWTRARTIVSDLLDELESGWFRAEALVLLSDLESVDRAAELLEEALREASERPRLQAAIHTRLASAARFRKGFREALPHARRALEIADELGDDALRARALIALAYLCDVTGDADAPAFASRAYEIAAAVGDQELMREATGSLASVLESSGHIDAARAMLEREYETWHERDELRAAEVLWALSGVELEGGRWQLAADYAARARDIHTQYALEVPQDLLRIAVAAVHRGQLGFAREQSERALHLAEDQMGLHPPIHLAVLGRAALWSGDAARAADWLGKADEQAKRLGWGEPGERAWTGDYVEALLELGRDDAAIRVLESWEADATRLGRARVLAHVTRCRGLVAASQGDVDGAASLLEQAVAEHEAVGDDFGRGRALLALGIVRRRARQKRAARDAIGAALSAFERLGAATWIERARRELASIGGRAREEGLTAAERRVAVLVAEGRSNREVAAALFLGERTVASHLTHIYAKLGVRSRTELALKVQTF